MLSASYPPVWNEKWRETSPLGEEVSREISAVSTGLSIDYRRLVALASRHISHGYAVRPPSNCRSFAGGFEG